MPEFFVVTNADPPWGDYGDILWNGLSRRDPPGTAVKLSRSGPYVPPLTLPFGEIVVVDSLRRALEAGRFTGFEFSEAQYENVVRIDWQAWDASSLEPPRYPETGEPEDYILKGSHDPSLLRDMPRLWALDVQPTLGLQVHGSSTFRLNRHPGTDIAREHSIFWVSGRLKDAMERSAGGWINFKRVVPR